jgi:DNA-binding FrmR family transcriptional regulator
MESAEKKPISKNQCHEPSLAHPSHRAQKNRLNRVRGQIDGIERMIDDVRYCVDIVTQIRAAKSALASLEQQILEIHLKECVHQAFSSKNKGLAEEKIQEILKIMSKE